MRRCRRSKNAQQKRVLVIQARRVGPIMNAQFFRSLKSKTKVDDEGVRYFLKRVPFAFGVVGLTEI
jgi:hypothetical protein